MMTLHEIKQELDILVEFDKAIESHDIVDGLFYKGNEISYELAVSIEDAIENLKREWWNRVHYLAKDEEEDC